MFAIKLTNSHNNQHKTEITTTTTTSI